MKRLFTNSLILLLSLPLALAANAEGIASQLFGRLKEMVYQVRVIDLASGDKSVIGSGFRVTTDGHVATNFHVVAPFVHRPDNFRLEYVFHDGSTGDLVLLGIDVIHDIAIVKLDNPSLNSFSLNSGQLAKGDRIYSMGNPHDLGMTIIEGNYNGLIKTSRYQKILFSGSLNGGMSGGPAIDEYGRVIGINVSKGGEQLSFLVPVKELVILLDRVLAQGETKDFEKEIKESLLSDQDKFFGPLLRKEWNSDPLMELSLPGQISESLKCWGHTLDDKDIRYEGVHQHCRSQDRIYLSKDLYTGTFFYDYEWTATERLNRFQFYNLLEQRYTHRGQGNVLKKEDATNYECHTDFVEVDNRSWRASSCFRAYKAYTGLYDALLLLASTDTNHKGAIIKAGATGISQDNAMALFRKLMDSIKWPR